MTDQITNSDDILDSRDIIARIEELEDLLDPELEGEDDLDEDREELKILQSVAEEGSGSPDWPHGETLIRESYFTEYAEELCKDIGAIPQELPWYIESHIDWEGVASDLLADYMSIDFDGVTYYIRA